MADSGSVNVSLNDDNVNDVIVVGSDGAAVWTNENEERFILLMEEEFIKGNRHTTTFSKPAWQRIQKALHKETRKNYNDIQLRNKFNQLRARQREFSKLLKETGIGYNASTSMVTAHDEVWERLYKVHKFAKRFRKKGCPMFDKLCLIYGDTTTTGFNKHPSTRSPEDTDNEEDDEVERVIEAHDASDGGVAPSSAVPQAIPIHLSSVRRGKKTNFSAALTCALNSISEHQKRKLDLMERKMKSPSSLCGSMVSNDRLVGEVMQALNTLEDIDGASYAKAVDRFHEDELWRRLFLQMPENRRRDWVLNLK